MLHGRAQSTASFATLRRGRRESGVPSLLNFRANNSQEYVHSDAGVSSANTDEALAQASPDVIDRIFENTLDSLGLSETSKKPMRQSTMEQKLVIIQQHYRKDNHVDKSHRVDDYIRLLHAYIDGGKGLGKVILQLKGHGSKNELNTTLRMLGRSFSDSRSAQQFVQKGGIKLLIELLARMQWKHKQHALNAKVHVYCELEYSVISCIKLCYNAPGAMEALTRNSDSAFVFVNCLDSRFLKTRTVACDILVFLSHKRWDTVYQAFQRAQSPRRPLFSTFVQQLNLVLGMFGTFGGRVRSTHASTEDARIAHEYALSALTLVHVMLAGCDGIWERKALRKELSLAGFDQSLSMMKSFARSEYPALLAHVDAYEGNQNADESSNKFEDRTQDPVELFKLMMEASGASQRRHLTSIVSHIAKIMDANDNKTSDKLLQKLSARVRSALSDEGLSADVEDIDWDRFVSKDVWQVQFDELSRTKLELEQLKALRDKDDIGELKARIALLSSKVAKYEDLLSQATEEQRLVEEKLQDAIQKMEKLHADAKNGNVRLAPTDKMNEKIVTREDSVYTSATELPKVVEVTESGIKEETSSSTQAQTADPAMAKPSSTVSVTKDKEESATVNSVTPPNMDGNDFSSAKVAPLTESKPLATENPTDAPETKIELTDESVASTPAPAVTTGGPPPAVVPPPPPPFGVPLIPPVKQKFKPSKDVKLKVIQFDKIPDMYVKKTIWDPFTKNDIDFEEKLGEDILRKVETKFSNNTTASEAFMKSKNDGVPEKIRVLDDKRAKNLGIVMNKLMKRCKLDDIRKALLTCDTTILGESELNTFLQSLPTDDEAQMLKEFYQSEEQFANLRDVEQLMTMVVTVKNYEPRMNSMIMKLQFHERSQALQATINKVTMALKKLAESKPFHRVLNLIRIVGNYMNASARKPLIHAFKINALDRIDTIKSPDGQSLVEYIAEIVGDKFPEDARFLEDLKLVREAEKVKVAEVEQEIDVLIKELEETKEQAEKYSAMETNKEEGDTFWDTILDFVQSSQRQQRSTGTIVGNMKHKFLEVANLFGEDISEYSEEKLKAFLEFVRKFLDKFEKSHFEHERRRAERAQAEKRRQERAAKLAASEGVDDVVEATHTSPRKPKHSKRQHKSEPHETTDSLIMQLKNANFTRLPQRSSSNNTDKTPELPDKKLTERKPSFSQVLANSAKTLLAGMKQEETEKTAEAAEEAVNAATKQQVVNAVQKDETTEVADKEDDEGEEIMTIDEATLPSVDEVSTTADLMTVDAASEICESDTASTTSCGFMFDFDPSKLLPVIAFDTASLLGDDENKFFTSWDDQSSIA